MKRFWDKVNKTETCWIWTACIFIGKQRGYGCFAIDGKNIQAHRFSYELVKERIREGFQLDHLCRNRRCVNPEHLEVVTQKVNILRGKSPAAINARKNKCPRGHELSEENIFKRKDKRRVCKICSNLRKRKRRKDKNWVFHGRVDP